MDRVIRLLILFCVAITSTQAEDFPFESGLRYGFSASAERSHEFHQTDVFANWNLPWQRNFGRAIETARPPSLTAWTLQPRFEASFGWLQQYHSGGFVGAFGPDLTLWWNKPRLALVGGLGLTFLGRSAYKSRDFGSSFQFNEHIGLNWQPAGRFVFGYRFQHMSNAGFHLHNPGLNLHLFSLGFRF